MNWAGLIRKFAGNRSGNFATVFALLAPILFGVIGGAFDIVVYNRQHAKMQDAADAAVLAATREATLKNWSQQEAEEVAKAYVSATLADAGLSSTAAFDIKTIADSINKKVSITLDMDQHRFFMLGYFRANPQIRVQAEAKLSSETPVCLVVLEPQLGKSANVYDSASVLAEGCAAYSNSTDKDGLFVDKKAHFASAFACTSGGFGNSESSFSPVPTNDCPPFPDPLSQRPQPTVGTCDHTKLELKGGDYTIKPGVYCDGLIVDNKARVTMEPGVYVINGGEFITKNSGELIGKGVTIFFTGIDGRLKLDGTSSVTLSAPVTGSTAGLLLMQDRSMALTDYEISSKSAAQLLGTIYLPNGRLKLNAPGNIAESSAFTVVVVRLLDMANMTKMYLNSDYAATSVPVPSGLGPSKGKIALVR